ncbi:tetratricopeptide repeat protein [Fretibacter rubidus]|uniref:tetratricopeptide repeat protein n=1 Tax=Fretibacter rubidus TaxID=570162 RepID=UPI00352B2F37
MTENFITQEISENLKSLLTFLASDPENVPLLSDCTELAVNENEWKLAAGLITRLTALGPLSQKNRGMAGLIAMRTQDFAKAAEHYEALLATGVDEPSVKFNLAWSIAMEKDFDRALELLDEATIKALPQAAMLHLQILHEQGKFDEAEALARDYSTAGIEHAGLNAAISVLAMDVEDINLAKASALKAGNHPDALTTLGTLALGDDDPEAALEMFNNALSINPHGPRSWIGKGLAQLVNGEREDAMNNIDKGAEMFGTHIGSWIAAGWAHFVQNDYKTARERFERALDIDDNFAESHGSLAVIDVVEGNLAEARRRTKTALRLDNECFSASLAQVLMLSSSGNEEKAKMIFERAINTPIDDTGRTISRSMTRMGLSSSFGQSSRTLH